MSYLNGIKGRSTNPGLLEKVRKHVRYKSPLKAYSKIMYNLENSKFGVDRDIVKFWGKNPNIVIYDKVFSLAYKHLKTDGYVFSRKREIASKNEYAAVPQILNREPILYLKLGSVNLSISNTKMVNSPLVC